MKSGPLTFRASVLLVVLPENILRYHMWERLVNTSETRLSQVVNKTVGGLFGVMDSSLAQHVRNLGFESRSMSTQFIH